jgi:hypothetical protein
MISMLHIAMDGMIMIIIMMMMIMVVMMAVGSTTMITALLAGEVMRYRGQNPNMHCVEALLAAYHVCYPQLRIGVL